MNYRIKFAKLEDLMYISHLEVIKTLRRIIRRAELPAAFSQGYNPRINLAIGPPLAVGLISKGEYFDLELTEELEAEELLSKLNSVSPDHLKFLKAVAVPDDIRSLSSLVDTAIYTINFEYTEAKSLETEKEMLEEFMSQDEIMIIRHRRKKEDRKIDLKKRIFSAEITDKNKWKFAVVTGSRGNVRPEELNRALRDKYSKIEEFSPLQVVREGVFVRDGESFDPPYAEKFIGS
ncbi:MULTISPECIES: TIGR03936 family radical SAM-associated protein [Halanaerobium]|jgi:radical SAM-linked protein|uniref:Radical SAM-linked protein n=1 Tax=Halanaerobium kushneri TaxID=56779 RepID=A0A1N6XTF1_9FIRM|nr:MULTISPECIES: TIGR03936 family radical SAM-associated protein [Halanaerobium]RCW54926.1 radical SAM-linked protein [Halanaerobium sp. ST460_2HS_T2]SIR05479.1 radical SAM-linked protein [Halanaerobium kushneri]